MIAYDPEHWWNLFWSYQGTVIPAIRVRVLVLTGLTLALALMDEFLYEAPQLNPLGHTLMGTVLGLLLVFRTNSSYDRYWEGRRLWGTLVNASRNLVRGGAVYVGDATDLADLVTAYVRAVKQTLRGTSDLSELAGLCPADVQRAAADAGNPPSVIAAQVSRWIARHLAAGTLQAPTAQLLEGHVATMVDAQGGCERIKRTPIPFVYAIHIRHVLMFYLATLPFVLLPAMTWCAPLVVAAVSFGLLGIEEAGLEIEDPFRLEPNSLPLDDVCATIQRDATMLAGMKK